MSKLRVVLWDQLSPTLPSFEKCDIKKDTIFLCEVNSFYSHKHHHKKKLVFMLSCLREFVTQLKKHNYNVIHVPITDKENTHTLQGEILRVLKTHSFSEIIITSPSEWHVLQEVEELKKKLKIPLHILADTRFFCSTSEFQKWASNRKELRMEFFYREMRKKHQILMTKDNQPEGGEWNYDKENRKPPSDNMHFPKRLSHTLTPTTKDVIELVSKKYEKNFGDIDPFYLAVTREKALEEMNHFMTHFLSEFGDHQDAMLTGEAFLFHSCLSAYLNIGLLDPLEVCQKAEEIYRKKRAPLNAVEGFIRQILGWREFIRGIYWLKMPDYGKMNFFQSTRPLPAFYWDADTPMHCLSEVVSQTKKYAYSHHIQRLMVTGNFALIAGLDVAEVCDWYWIVYSDAYEWVELPNTLGMALFGDGGVFASKPYAASGKYIHKMSNFCDSCIYDPEEVLGDKACPFNSLYWDFIQRNEKDLRKNHRMVYMYSAWDKMNDEKKKAIKAKATAFLKQGIFEKRIKK